MLGVAVAEDRYLLACVLALLNFLTLRVLLPYKLKMDAKEDNKTDASRD